MPMHGGSGDHPVVRTRPLQELLIFNSLTYRILNFMAIKGTRSPMCSAITHILRATQAGYCPLVVSKNHERSSWYWPNMNHPSLALWPFKEFHQSPSTIRTPGYKMIQKPDQNGQLKGMPGWPGVPPLTAVDSCLYIFSGRKGLCWFSHKQSPNHRKQIIEIR